MSRKALLLSFVLLAISVLSQSAAPTHFDGKTWWEHVKVIAADDMEGRETGSEGLRKAEAYVVEQLQKAGLQPAGTDGFYQPVKFQTLQIVEKESSLSLIHDAKTEPLVLGEDADLSTRMDAAPQVEAPLVFVGYGLTIPEKNYDDLAGLDLQGKVAVEVSAAPGDIPGALAAHYQSGAERWKVLHKAGAIGIIGIPNPASMDIPWSRMALNRTHIGMLLADPKFQNTEGQKLYVTFNPQKADKLFAGSGHSFQEIVAAAKEHKQLPRFPLAVSIKAKVKMEKGEVESANIVARLPGTDSQLKDEYVVLSAHIDHIGIGEPINGDKIYNGAMDNGSGSAALMDIAASMKKARERTKRSLLFVFVTGEEKGLLGSRYFTADPTVPPHAMVADINTDMFLPIVPLKFLTVLGLAESDLGDAAAKAAEAHGVHAQPDPNPQRNTFIRSDQYNFIRHGIPAVAMDIAPDPASAPQKQLFKDWLTNRYHAPSDDLDQPVNLDSAAVYEEIVRTLMISVADSPERPQWKPDSFFRRYAEQPSQY